MLVKFTKMHAYGNDFMIFDFRKQYTNKVLGTSEMIFAADRNFGVGCDQVFVIYPSDKPDDEKGVNIVAHIFNQNGTVAKQCGNGMRCLAGLIAKETTKSLVRITIPTGAVILAKPIPKLSYAKVNMGIPTINNDMVEIGNKHKIIIVETFDGIDRMPVDDYNINYVKINSREEIFVRTIETGVGETMSCGSGGCASAAYCIANNLVEKKLKVISRGSDIMGDSIDVSQDGIGKPMLMGGKYFFTFTGEIELFLDDKK